MSRRVKKPYDRGGHGSVTLFKHTLTGM